MNASELLRFQLDDAGYQLSKSLEGMTDADLDHRITPSAMTPREIVEHLCEAYQALVTTAAGGKHEWGSFSVEDKSWPNLSNIFQDLRSRACEAALSGDEDALKHGHEFIVGHDYYHVGQICASRAVTQPEWDFYSIYRSS